MKNKKLFLPAIILAVAVVAIAVYLFVSNIALKPTVTEAKFPFKIIYEVDGETVTIDDVYKVYYVRNGGYTDTKSRVYEGKLESSGEDDTLYTLKKDENGRIELWTHFHADYLMGDTEYDYFDGEAFEPKIYYYDVNETEYRDEETLAEQGVRLISFEYPTPIENSFVFSHISYFSSAVVLPILLISLLALIAIIIFVRKEKELNYKAKDIVCIVLNFAIGFTLIPFVTIAAILIDINGGGPEVDRQVFYLLPSLFVLCTAASVALRRKGYGKSALITEFIGPVIFVLCAIVL